MKKGENSFKSSKKLAHESNAEENRQFFGVWFEGFAICWTFRKGVNSLWRKKMMILMCSGDRASVRACARVWNVVFCLYFLIVFIIYAKKKRTAWWWSRCKISNKIWFDSLTGKENRQFPFRGPNTESERKHTFIFATLSASEMSAFPGEDRREMWDILRPWNGLISAAARSVFSFFCLTSFLRACKCGFVGELMRIHADGIKENKRKKKV